MNTLRQVTAALSVLLFLLSAIHRIVFETCPDDYVGHWTELPIVYTTIALLFMIPSMVVISLVSIPRKRRHHILPNLVILFFGISVLFVASFVIDPMLMLHAT